MHVVLSVSTIRVKDIPYFRVNLPKELTDRLGILGGDKLTVDIKAVKRDGQLIYSAEATPNAQ